MGKFDHDNAAINCSYLFREVTPKITESEYVKGQTIPGLDGMMITRNGDQFHVSNHPYMSSRYRSMKVYLDSVPYDTGSGNRWYWPDESIYAEVPLTSGFTSPSPSNSGAPVSISVGDFQPIGGQ